MEWLWKGMLTMASVALVLALARRWGGSAAGLVAGLPTTTAPALAWMASEHGVGFAAEAATATVAACGLMAAFALAYAHAASAPCRPRFALACGLAAALAMAAPVLACGSDLAAALAVGLGSCGVALLAWPGHSGGPRQDTGKAAPQPAALPAALPAVLPAAAAGGVSLILGLAGPAIGTVCAGLLASLPVVSVTVALAQHAGGGPAVARQFLHGTAAGLLGRVAFGAVFAVAVHGTPLMLALGLALGAAVAVNLAAGKALARSRAKSSHARLHGAGGTAAALCRSPTPWNTATGDARDDAGASSKIAALSD